MGFLSAILAVVIYFAVTRRDRIENPQAPGPSERTRRAAVVHAVVVVTALLGLGVTGYCLRSSQLQRRAAASASPDLPLGDLSPFRTIVQDMLRFVRLGDWTGVMSRAADLETAWDNDRSRMQPMSPDKWTSMDNAIDDVLKKSRSLSHDASGTSASLQALLAVIDVLDHPAPAARVTGSP